MKRFLLGLFFLLCSLQFFAQSGYVDVIYLKNGSIIKGVIIEQVPNVKYTIKMADGSQFVFTIEEIEKITKEEIASKKKSGGDITPATDKFTSYNFIGSNPVFTDSVLAGFSLSTENGFRFKNYFLGAGIGMDIYDGIYFIPVYANFKYYIKEQTWSPYAYADVGYAYGKLSAWDGRNRGGFTLGGGIGVNFFQTETFSFVGKIGYRLQNFITDRLEMEWDHWLQAPVPTGNIFQQRVEWSMLNIGIGISF